jgi:hypothetical protein
LNSKEKREKTVLDFFYKIINSKFFGVKLFVKEISRYLHETNSNTSGTSKIICGMELRGKRYKGQTSGGWPLDDPVSLP